MNKKYPAINWTDGVKINKDHFLENHAHILNTIKDYATVEITNFNYGLLEAKSEMINPLNIQIVTQTEERLVLRLIYCNAITRNGCRIDYDVETYGGNGLEASLEIKDIDVQINSEFLVLISVNPFELVPIGDPDPECIPLHHPYAMPKVSMTIVSKSQFNTSFLNTNYIIAQKFQWKDGVFIIDKEFIPPTSRIKYHPNLSTFHRDISEALNELRKSVILINQKNRHKFATNKLASNTFKLCLKVLDFNANHLLKFTQAGPEESPFFIVQNISTLASHFSNELVLMEEKDRESLLQYFYDWINVKPSVLQDLINDIASLQYKHHEIREAMNKIDYFMALMDRLWKKLGALEYIGQQKENIVIGEDSLTLNQSKKEHWSVED